MIKSKAIAIAIFIIYLFSFSYAIAISPGIINVNYKPNERLNLSFKIVNIKNKDNEFILYSDSKFIDIPKEINISKNEKEKTINFTLEFLNKKISKKIINIYIIEKKAGNLIFAREGAKLSIIIHNITTNISESKQNTTQNITQKEIKEEIVEKKAKKQFENKSKNKEFTNKKIKEKIEKFEILSNFINFIKIVANPTNLIKSIIFKNS